MVPFMKTTLLIFYYYGIRNILLLWDSCHYVNASIASLSAFVFLANAVHHTQRITLVCFMNCNVKRAALFAA
jgi:hypothetical protein